MIRSDTNELLIEVRNLRKYFPITKGLIVQRRVGDVKAVDSVSFKIKRGETLGLVGESGCGKTTTGRTLLHLYQPTGGEVFYSGVNLEDLSPKEMRQMRTKLQIIFQDPYSSLNPRMTVENIISEAMVYHGIVPRNQRRARVEELLSMTGLNPGYARRYPHEFSGGQRQRIGIARALAMEPEFIVCDEPISALDVSIQAQVVNLLKQLQNSLGLTYLFIAHDLSMVRHISDRVAVMYLGKIVEITSSRSLYRNPKHPYTQSLLSAVPIPDPSLEARRDRTILEGTVPSPSNPPKGCNFNTRCPVAVDVCFQEEPPLELCEEDHEVACHLVTTKNTPTSSE